MKIRDARKAAGLTQEDLAKELDINRSTLSKYESGIISPTLEMLARIAIAINKPVQDLLPEDKPDPFGWSTNERAIDIQESERENRLLMAFYGLNYEGQNRVIEYTEDLNGNPKYNVHSKPRLEEITSTNNLPQEKEKPTEGE